MKKIIYFCFAILLFSCNSAQKPIEMNLNVISKGNLYGNGQEGINEQHTVIKTEKEWLDLKQKMNATGNLTQELNSISVNFKEKILIAIFDKKRTTGGHSVEIVQTDQIPGEIKIGFKKTSPEGMATSVMTQPYYLATITKTDKKIMFEEIK
jgi:hypothetical protein